jgi:polyisoprenoid-binding protein YceI
MKMFKWLFSSLIIIIAFSISHAQPVSLKVNAEKSTVNWLGKKLLGQHEGVVSIADGSVVMNNGVLGGGEFSIDMTTIACTDISDADMNAKLIGHLKSDDFFSVQKNPTATLKITKVLRLTDPTKSGNYYQVTADLTIKGIKHPVEFPVTVVNKGKYYTASAKFTIDRSKWDVRYGSSSFFDNLGDKAIKNDIEFAVLLQFN